MGIPRVFGRRQLKLVFLHGRAQEGKDAEELRLFWLGCLAEGFRSAYLPWPTRLEVVSPFYADELERLVDQVDAPLVSHLLERGDYSPRSDLSLRMELLQEIANVRGIQPNLLATGFSDAALERGPQNWRWILAILRSIDSTAMGFAALDQFTRDVSVYLTYCGVRDRIDGIVAERLPTEPFVLVAHSLGSIIAYNVLRRRCSASPTVTLFLTIGSPLGIDAVRLRVERPLCMPTGVAQWTNARDNADLVALFPLDEVRFGIDPPIENYSAIENRSSNRHSVEGYLRDPFVAGKIGNALAPLLERTHDTT